MRRDFSSMDAVAFGIVGWTPIFLLAIGQIELAGLYVLLFAGSILAGLGLAEIAWIVRFVIEENDRYRQAFEEFDRL